MKSFTFTIVFTLILVSCGSNKSDSHTSDESLAVVGFYNLENLFDTIDSPDVWDEEFMPQSPKKWNTQRYQNKLDRLADVIYAIGDTAGVKGPAVMGLCEVENEGVVHDLTTKTILKPLAYKSVHVDSPDRRGIDVAFIYQPKAFVLDAYKAVPLIIHDQRKGNQIYTRDQLVISGRLMGQKTHFIINHWPSRYGGEERSRPARLKAALLCRSLIDSLQTIDSLANIIVMGDFNDNPHDVSVKEILHAVTKDELSKGALFNTLAEKHQNGEGSLCYRGDWKMFDQIMVTPGFLQDDQTLQYHGAFVYATPIMRVSEGKYAGYPFRTYVRDNYHGGYSDHFPVFMKLKKN